MMKKLGWIALLFLCLLLAPQTADAGALDGMLPEGSPVNSEKPVNEEELYEKFDLDAYRFDGFYDDKGPDGVIYTAFNFLAGLGMQLLALGFKILIYLFQWMVDLPHFKSMAREISNLTEYLGSHFFAEVLKIGYIIIGVYILFEMAKRQYADSMKEVGKILLMLALATVLFNNMYDVLIKVDDFSGTGADVIMEGVETYWKDAEEEPQDARTETHEMKKEAYRIQDDPGKKALVKTSNRIWTNFVVIPWQLAEFGESMDPKAKISPQSEDRIARLTYQVLSSDGKKRKDLTKKIGKPQENLGDTVKNYLQWVPGVDKLLKKVEGERDKPKVLFPQISSEGGVGTRIIIVAVMFVVAAIFGPLLTILALFTAGYKIGFLVLGVLAPFIFLYACWPKGGIWSVINWAKQWIGAGLYYMIAMLLLGLYLLLSTGIFSWGKSMGWLFAGVFLQILVLGILVWQHKRVFKLFKAPVNQVKSSYHKILQNGGQGIQVVGDRMERMSNWAVEKGGQGIKQGAMLGAHGVRSGKAMYQGGKAYLQSYLMGSSGSKQRPPRYAEPTRNNNTNWQETPDGLYRRGGAPQGSAPRGMIGGTTNRAIPVATRRQTALPVSSPAPISGNGVTYVPTNRSIQNGRIVNGQKYERVKAVLKDERTKAVAKAAGKVAIRAGIKAVAKI